ncbi:hypothetical protein HN682_07355, partial [Candidatus Peregrinibacteria bacterium]|nr:hypothetical protein [Candidatus Peregrinibacteria bacterium]
MLTEANRGELRTLDGILGDPELSKMLASASVQPYLRAEIAAQLMEQSEVPLKIEKTELASAVKGEIVERTSGLAPTPDSVGWDEAEKFGAALDIRDETGKGAVGGYVFARAFGKMLAGDEMTEQDLLTMRGALASGLKTSNFDDEQSGLADVVGQVERIKALMVNEGVESAGELSDATKKTLRADYGADRSDALIEDYAILEDVVEFAKKENMVTVTQDRKTKELSYADNAGWQNNGFMEQILVTGDLQMARAFRGISRLSRDARLEGRDLSSAEALEEYFSEENASIRLGRDKVDKIDSAEGFAERLATFTHLAAFGSTTKKNASDGHWNNGAHVLLDGNGDVQFMDPYTAQKLMYGSARKNDKNFEPQSASAVQRGRTNSADYMQMMSPDFFRGSNIVSATNHTSWLRSMKNKIRNIREIGNGSRGDLKETDTETGAGIYGGNEEHIEAFGYGDYAFGLMSHMIGNALPLLAEGGNTFAFAQQSEFANLAQPMDFQKGFVHATYAGIKANREALGLAGLGYDSEESLEFGHTADMAEFVHKFLTNKMGEVNVAMEAQIAAAKAYREANNGESEEMADGTVHDERWQYAVESQMQVNREYLEDQGGQEFIDKLETRATSLKSTIARDRIDSETGRVKISGMTPSVLAGNSELVEAQEQEQAAEIAMREAREKLKTASPAEREAAQADYTQKEADHAVAMSRRQDVYMGTASAEELEQAAAQRDTE